MKYLYIFLAICIMSCDGENSDKPLETSQENKKLNTKKTSCLSEITDPGKWYSSSKVAALTKISETDIEKKATEKYNQLQFNWKSDRKYTMKIGNSEMELPANNGIAITIKNLDEAIEKATRLHKNRTFTYAEYFDSYHAQITKEDQKIIDAEIDKKGEEDKNFDAKTAKKILAMAPTEGYSDISGLGDDANKYIQLAPGLRETRLAVLHGNVVILLNVDISDDDETDFEAAKQIAKDVMALCN